VVSAAAAVDRARFVPRDLAGEAWADGPLPIGGHQTISQPLVVAVMCELLELSERDTVLDVGTGSGYHAALLAHLAAHVDSIERDPELAERAQHNLEAAGVENVALFVGDGSRGVPDGGPYDAINVAAAASPEAIDELAEQLAPGGRLVAPVGGRRGQKLVVVRRDGARWRRTTHGRVRFVPLLIGD
jgi:protein-L-isoaspartate(D-aspartate) O-methyltransferase